MKSLVSGQTSLVRYKDEAFEQIVRSLRSRPGTSQTTQIVFTGSGKQQMKLAARNLAMRLGKQLCPVDLSTVQGKYIGETEKNLSKILDKASAANLILYFDEADALFGKRTNVRDAHDKYANQETSYLLQKLEKFKGIVILTTNSKSGGVCKTQIIKKYNIVVQLPV